jgi:hypothetical protein
VNTEYHIGTKGLLLESYINILISIPHAKGAKLLMIYSKLPLIWHVWGIEFTIFMGQTIMKFRTSKHIFFFNSCIGIVQGYVANWWAKDCGYVYWNTVINSASLESFLQFQICSNAQYRKSFSLTNDLFNKKKENVYVTNSTLAISFTNVLYHLQLVTHKSKQTVHCYLKFSTCFVVLVYHN